MTLDNAIILLPCSTRSSLNWSEARARAKELSADNMNIIWELEMGLFHNLEAHLSDEAQASTLQFNIRHFQSTLLEEFKQETRGIILYRGNVDFSLSFPWGFDERELFERSQEKEAQIFCRELCLDYLKLLALTFPEEISLYIHLDASKIESQASYLRLLSKEAFEHFQLQIENWKGTIAVHSSSFGLLLPSSYSAKGWLQVDRALSHSLPPFRLCHELFFEQEWEGLDTILVFPEALTAQGKRKLAGFEAAGGKIINFQDGASNLSLQEISQLVCHPVALETVQ